ncbi:hypothetical protein HYFRA_00005759 [Hymenoscyphus fraxineus]|uniref:Uncharacterized protein n=1 Tax=Hymenoscyphus fraxineus TaxID=746836 RepID=A0A9N9PRY1_9HELO|nr:hypothetical protein HYFRA_00005759 [Hymenoscyphus fraxineus]
MRSRLAIVSSSHDVDASLYKCQQELLVHSTWAASAASQVGAGDVVYHRGRYNPSHDKESVKITYRCPGAPEADVDGQILECHHLQHEPHPAPSHVSGHPFNFQPRSVIPTSKNDKFKANKASSF